jgi:hypothetical protein
MVKKKAKKKVAKKKATKKKAVKKKTTKSGDSSYDGKGSKEKVEKRVEEEGIGNGWKQVGSNVLEVEPYNITSSQQTEGIESKTTDSDGIGDGWKQEGWKGEREITANGGSKYGEGKFGEGPYGGKESKEEEEQKLIGEAEDEDVENVDISSKSEDKIVGATICGFSVPDQPTKIDTLGFEPYTTAIKNFLSHKDTKAPITMSVEGEWGSGKTSFMMQIEEKLKSKDSIIVKFSPWRYDDQESLWTAFVLAFTKQIAGQLGFCHSLKSYFKLLYARFNWQEDWIEFTRIIIKFFAYIILFVFIIISLWAGWIPYIDETGSKTFISVCGAAAVVWQVLKKGREVIGNPFKSDLKKSIQTADYTSRISIIEKFHNDFRKMVENYAGKKRIYIFIDDLDRCGIPQAAKLMQAINLMISDNPQVVFIMGMDREKVAAGLAVKDKELIRYLKPEMIGQKSDGYEGTDWITGLRYGYTFIEKFIQLPFAIPKPTNSDIDNMMGLSIESKAIKEDIRDVKDGDDSRKKKEIRKDGESEKNQKDVERKQLELKIADDSNQVGEIVHMVSSSLDFNPRRIKQFINLFRLRAYIAYETQLLILPEDVGITNGVTLEQLGKIVAISLRWPLLLEALAKDENLLTELSKFAEGGIDHTSLTTEVAKHYSQDNQLMELIRFGCVRGKAEPYEFTKNTLSGAKIDKILQVSPRIRSVEVANLEVMVSDTIGISDAGMAEVKTSEKSTESSESEVNKEVG